MKKIRYAIVGKKVRKEVYDTKLGLVLNFVGLYEGETKKECEEWLADYLDELEIKKELRKVKNIC